MVDMFSPLRPAKLLPGGGVLCGSGHMAYGQAAHLLALTAGVRAWGLVQGVLCHGVRSETIPQLGIILPDVKCSRFWPSPLGRVLAGAQPERLIRVTTPLRVVAPAPHHRVYKSTGRGAVRAFSVCWWFSVPAHRSWFLLAGPALCLDWD